MRRYRAFRQGMPYEAKKLENSPILLGMKHPIDRSKRLRSPSEKPQNAATRGGEKEKYFKGNECGVRAETAHSSSASLKMLSESPILRFCEARHSLYHTGNRREVAASNGRYGL